MLYRIKFHYAIIKQFINSNWICMFNELATDAVRWFTRTVLHI